MRHLVLLLLLTHVLASGWPGRAAEPEPAAAEARPVTLDEAVSLAREHSPRLQGLEALRSASEAGVRAALAEGRPSLDVDAAYVRHSNVPELTIPVGGIDRTIFPNIPDNYRMRVQASYPLLTGGRVPGRLESARHELSAAGSDLDAGAADVVLETTEAYWGLVTARESERVLREAMASYDAHLDDARNREHFGVAAHNEVLAVQVERDRAELARLRAENGAKVANADLVRLLGLDPGVVVEPVETLDRAVSITDELEDLVRRALDHRPERGALEDRIAAARAAVRVDRSARRPQVSVAAGYDFSRPNPLILPPEDRWNDTWDVTVGLSMNLFDGGRAAAAVARTTSRAEALALELEDLDRHIRLQVTSRLLDLHTAQRGVEVSESNLESAQENLRIARDRYHEGVIPSSELLDAETALLNAGLDRTASLAGLQLARAGLDRALGE